MLLDGLRLIFVFVHILDFYFVFASFFFFFTVKASLIFPEMSSLVDAKLAFKRPHVI